jgi:hypothetical protein
MFMIRQEQGRIAAMDTLVQRVLANTESTTLWTPGLALLLVETGSHEAAAEALAPVRETDFNLPIDAGWSTVMVLLIETRVALGDVEDARFCAIDSNGSPARTC